MPNIALLHRPYAEIVLVTPAMARALLERNASNRKFRMYHRNRLVRLIKGGRWKFNGDTIKIDFEGNLQDGQHRLCAIIEANQSCQSVVVYGVERNAFSTIDTMRLQRSFADVVQLSKIGNGETKYYALVGSATAWLCRWDRGMFQEAYPELRSPDHKVENDEIENKLRSDPDIIQLVQRAYEIRAVVPVPMFAFFMHVLIRKGANDIAERLFSAMKDSSALPIDDPYLLLRRWLQNGAKRHESLHALAMMIKATNYVARDQPSRTLIWHNSGKKPETFPQLDIDHVEGVK
jgi:hypothetical protein